MKIKDLLIEKTVLPMYLNGIKGSIKKLKSKLWDKDLSTAEIIENLEKELGKYLIRFNEVYHDNESEYTSVGLNGGELSMSGWITINYTNHIEDVMGNGGRVYYEDFVRLISALIGHELTHREQLLKSSANADNIKEPDDLKKYLSDHREIEAYAVQSALELLDQFDLQEIFSKLKTDRGLDELSMYSEGLKWYVHSFNTNTPVFKKFLKKLISVLEGDEE